MDTVIKIAALIACASLSAGFAQQAAPEPERAFAAARAVSPTPLRLDRDREAWLEARRDAAFRDDVDAQWSERWTADVARDGAVRAIGVTPADLPAGCVDIGISGCKTLSGGYLNINGERLMWQLQDGFTEEDGRAAGYVLLTGADRLHPVAWGREALWYEAPQVFGDDEHAYVRIAGGMAGTGSFNADVLFRYRPGAEPRLEEIDTESWRERDLPALLPPRLEIWKGVAYSDTMQSARAGLWRPDDGNCCPTGGAATLMFEIRGNRLVLTALTRDPPAD
jgi:hypothetical protein